MKDAQTRSAWLHEALSELSERERRIITERHLADEVVTLEDLGKELGVSKERVRQLEARAMDKIKASMSRHIEDSRELILAD
jgi:RNA polymerase sigma-32 factor